MLPETKNFRRQFEKPEKGLPMNYKRIISAMALVSVGATPALSETGIEKFNRHRDTVTECLTAVESGDSTLVSELAQEIKSFTQVSNYDLQKDAAACLKAATGETWFYHTGYREFTTTALMNAAASEAKMRAEGEALANAVSQVVGVMYNSLEKSYNARLRADVSTQTRRACDSLYEDDAIEALTNAVCSGVFMQVGLPGSLSFEAFLISMPEMLDFSDNQVLVERVQASSEGALEFACTELGENKCAILKGMR